MTRGSAARRQHRARPDDDVAEFEIDPTPIWSPDDWRLEPVFMAGPLWVDFEEPDRRDPLLPLRQAEAPLLVDFEDWLPLDPGRASVAPEEPPPGPGRPASAISLLGSLGVHLLVLLGLLNWSSEAAETGPPIAVQLVVEQPAPAPPAPQDEKPAAVEPAAPQPKEAPVPAPPKPTPVVAAKPPPKPAPPKPPAPTPKPARTTVAVRPPQPERAVERPGPDFTRSDYFAQLVQMTRPHLGLLPLSFLAGRSGKTTLSILVLPDGTIAHIAVKESSGYPDIDARVEQIVAAVGRFPPLPPSYQGRNLELNFDLKFPDALAGP